MKQGKKIVLHYKLLLTIIFLCVINPLHTFSQKNNYDTFYSFYKKGMSYFDKNDHKNAVLNFTAARNIYAQLFGNTDTTYADVTVYLAYSYLPQKKLKEPLLLYIEAKSIYDNYKGSNHANYPILNIAQLYYELREFAKSEISFLEYINYLKKSNQFDINYLDALQRLSEVYIKMNQYDNLLKTKLEILDLLKKYYPLEKESYLSNLNIIGNIYLSKFDFINAEKFYKQALTYNETMFLGIDNEKNNAIINGSLGELYFESGYYAKAESIFLKNLEIIKNRFGIENELYAGGLYNLALVYKKLNNIEKARTICLKTLEIQSKISTSNLDYARTKLALASIMRSIYGTNLSEVEKLIKEAMIILKNKQGEFGMDYINSVQNLANLYCYYEEYSKAIPMYLQVIKIRKEVLGVNHPEYAKAISNLASAYREQGNIKKAESFYSETLTNYKNIFNEGAEQLTDAYRNLANLYETKQDIFKIKEFQIKSMTSLKKGNLNNIIALSENEKLNYLEHIESNFNQFNSTLYKYASSDKTFLQNSYNMEMQNKSFTLRSTQQIKSTIANSKDTSLLNKYQELVNTRKILSTNYSLPQKNQQKNLNELEEKAEMLEKKLAQEAVLYPYISEQLKYTFKDVINSIDTNEAAIEFLSFQYYNNNSSDSILYCAMLLKKDFNEPKFFYLFEEKQLSTIIKKEKNVFEPKYINNLYKQNGEVNALFQLIWKPIYSQLQGVHTIYVAPSGLLHKIALGAIPINDSNSISSKHELQIVGTTADIINKKNEFIDKKSIQQAIIFGGINYDVASTKSFDYINTNNAEVYTNVPTDSSRGTNGKWNYLGGTSIEAEEVKKQFIKQNISTIISKDSFATETNFKTLSFIKSSVLHIATHGYFLQDIEKKIKANKESPNDIKQNSLFRSGLIFAGANPTWTNSNYVSTATDDGILTAFEISNLDLNNVKLVVLSACETGLGDIKGSEGVFGLQRSFKLAGAKNIIMSLWSVPDLQTKELMTLFYENCFAGLSVSAALRNAQFTMSKKYSPYYWAAFKLLE